MNNLMIFEDRQVEVINNNEEILFELYSVGQALGYERSNGKPKGEQGVHKLYPYKSRIDKVIEKAEIEPYVYEDNKYLTEDMLYDFLFEAKTDKAKSFRKWVKEVLVEIRENGAYVSQNITKEQEDKLLKYSAPRFRKQVFISTPIEQLKDTYKECMEYHKRKPALEKNKIKKEIIKVLEAREEVALNNGSAPLALLIAEEIKTIQKDITISANRSNGMKISKANKEIIELKEALHQLDPNIDEYYTINFHPFTVNCCTQAYNHTIVSTPSYKKWKNNFPTEEFPTELNIDFDKPVFIWMYFDHQYKYDVANFHKTFIDMLCSHYKVDDKNINIMRCCTNNYVDSYKDGKIHFAIRQGEWA